MKTLFVGLTTVDIQYFIDTHPLPNTKVKTGAPDIIIGGPAANAAIACSFLGAEVHFLTQFGHNPFQTLFLEDMSRHDVTVHDLVSTQDHAAVMATVLTDKTNGDRTIVTNNPEDDPSLEHAAEQLLQDVAFDLVLWDGFYPSIAKPILAYAKKNNIPVVFDGGSWKPWLTPLLSFVDIAICSEVFLPPNCSLSHDVFDFLAAYNIDHQCITRGEKPMLLRDKRNEIININIETVQHVFDTLGAGDIFHGAFCYFYQKEKDIETALLNASKVVGRSIQCAGTRSWMKEH